MKSRKRSHVSLVSLLCRMLFLHACAIGGTMADPVVPAESQPASTAAERPLNDAHCHYVNFVQDTDGMAVLLKTMDESGVRNIVLFGLPLVKKWEAADTKRPTYYNDNDAKVYYYGTTDMILARAVLELPAGQRARVHPMICGFNPTDKNAIDHIRRMIEWYPGLWEGIGEILTRHDDLTRMTSDETGRANHPALNAVYDFAAENDLPVWLHSNVGTVGVEEPIYLDEVRTAVKDHPKTRFVWCHAGHSRNLKIPSLAPRVDELLEVNKNLWVDLSWVIYEDLIAPGGKLDPKWVALVEKYPDRFMIGSDKIGKFATFKTEIRKYDPLLQALSPATAQRVAQDNLWSLLPAKSKHD